MSDKFAEAYIHLPDGRLAYDCAKLVTIETEGVFLKDYPNHVLMVNTKNTSYGFITRNGIVEGKAAAVVEGGREPRYLTEHTKNIDIHGSTFGGSMIKVGYIGVDMHLEFSYPEHPKSIVTTAIQSIRICPITTPVGEVAAV